jgi:uncharacterized protein (DUF983 family)
MHNVRSVVCLVIAGFFVYMVCLLAFANFGVAKYVMCAVFLIPVFALSLVGVKLNKSRPWRKSVGLVFMWGAITTFFLILTLVCMLASPDIRKMFPADSFAFFSDYIAGTLVTVLFLSGGYGLQRLENQKTAEQITLKDDA